MKHRARRPRRFRRPLPQQPTRAQVRQRIRRLCSLHQLEALLELQQPEPSVDHLRRLDAHIGFFTEALTCLEEQHE